MWEITIAGMGTTGFWETELFESWSKEKLVVQPREPPSRQNGSD